MPVVYICLVLLAGMFYKSLRTEIWFLSSEETPDFRARLKDVSGREGDDVELECLLTKANIPVRWLKNRKPLTPSDRIKIVCDRYRHMLRIMETIPEDEGEYTVILGDDKESSATLTIYGKYKVLIFVLLP